MTVLNHRHVAFLIYQLKVHVPGSAVILVLRIRFAALMVFVVTAALAVKTKKSVYMAHALRHVKVILTVTKLPNYRV